MLYVVEIVAKLTVGVGDVAAGLTTRLRPAGQAGADEVTQTIMRQELFESANLLGPLGRRADQGHVAANDVPELRDPGQMRMTQEPADAGQV